MLHRSPILRSYFTKSSPQIGCVNPDRRDPNPINFTTCDTPEQAASFVGLVPRQQQSGQWEGKRFIGHAGHARLRHVLYIATISALRFNPIIKRHYERLIKKGKPGKVAVIAAERKLLTIAWACVKYERMFDPAYEVRGGDRDDGEGS